MMEVLAWWFAVTLVGAVAFPIAFAFFHRLPDRGYAFAKVVGLLLLGYALWIGATTGLFPNSRGSIILLLALMAVLSLALARRYRRELGDFFREGWRYVLFVEGFFALAFAIAVTLRSFAPEIQWGEKPFELAFLSALNRNELFPPEDPWLSGHPISYYYFGYLMMAALTKLTGLGTNVSFYLSLSVVGALAATAIFGLVYNMIAAVRGSKLETGESRLDAGPSLLPRAVGFGVTGAVLLLLVSNLEGVFELMARHGLGSAAFYGKLGIHNLPGPYVCTAAPQDCADWYPTRFWWWWKATRIGSDWDIQEFPFFSFHFGDLHPHVIGLPFVITAVAIAFNFLRSDDPLDAGWPLRHPWRLLFAGLFIGGLGFINLWDLPTFYLLVVAVIFVANWLRRGQIDAGTIGGTAAIAAPIGVLAVLLYIPFYLTFDTGTNGIALVEAAEGVRPAYAPLDSTVTRPLHFLLFWTPLLWLGLSFVAARLWRSEEGEVRRPRILVSVLPWLGPLALWGLLVLIKRGPGGLLDELDARGPNLLTLLMLALVLAAAAFAFARELSREHADEESRRPDGRPYGRSYVFALLAIGLGLLLILGPELFFINDINGFRPNTVFKLWFQGWMLLSVGGAFGLYHLTRGWRLPSFAPTRVLAPSIGSGQALGRLGWASLTAAVLAAALVYTVTASMERTGGFNGDQHLDGLVYIQGIHPGEYEAIRWLNQNVAGTPVLLEAVDQHYSDGARISSRTGLPAVLGWPEHERLWRGSDAAQAGREEAARIVYQTTNIELAQNALRQYDVQLVYVGWLERQKYDPGGQHPEYFDKFASFLEPVYQNDEVIIYRVPESGPAAVRQP